MNSSNIKVSIVVPIYNVKSYLVECLDSILAQSLSEIEIILINDGSTDGSDVICDEYAKKDKRIKVIHKKNRGYGHTINTGVSEAVGEYIGIVESDDYISSNMYEELYETVKKHDLDMVKSEYYSFYQVNHKKTYEMEHCTVNRFHENNVVLGEKDKKKGLLYSGANWTGLYRRDFVKNCGIFHNESPGASYQDTGFALQTFLLAERFMFLSSSFYHYRVDNLNSSVHQKNKLECILEEMKFAEKEQPSVFLEYQEEILSFYLETICFDLKRLDDEAIKPYLSMVKEYLLQQQAKRIYQGTALTPSMKTLLQEIVSGEAEENIIRKKRELKAEIENFQDFSEIILFGAGYYGRKSRERLRLLLLEDKISSFAVSDLEETFVDHIPIKKITDITANPKALLLVCVKDATKSMDDMIEIGKKLGFYSVIPCQELLQQYRKKEDYYL